ncbi:hypothetical protein O3V59_05810 [Brevibacillus thermoruber]|uniref:Restriction endonuclease type IV Mrr domain-containing protein n=1 Tax=Brevibacillus thermoruber TaxID=33942 RepID=A0A9X3TNX6_9BACL|nr:hypothetical protein [Brevibacillus thermoruber]MDA5107865.1 hypothetical protein [Brevibacillus thermoruber]
MSISQELSKLQDVFKRLSDDKIWIPFADDSAAMHKFLSLIDEVEHSQSWPSTHNQRKGKVYEKLIRVVLDQFQVGETESDFRVGDNQIDHEFRFNDFFVTHFTQETGQTIICECKNEKSPVDVTYMSKLIELCENRKSKLGIFFSIVGLTGKGWVYAEGKRKKNLLKHGIAIISFTFEEIKQLTKKNFYTLIKEKFEKLVREVDEELDDIRQYPQEDLYSFNSRLKSTVNELFRLNLIDDESRTKILSKIDKLYAEES